MDKSLLLPFGLLFGLFGAFLGILAWRSRHNRAHPPEFDPPKVQARRRWISSAISMACLAFAIYIYLQQTRFEATWTVVAGGALIAFCIGDGFGRWDTKRRIKEGHSTPDP
jgi:peptidoglycan/LPS O-acetylase OafA/YrhL